MSGSRLRWLLAVMVGLILLRLWGLREDAQPVPLSEAVNRPTPGTADAKLQVAPERRGRPPIRELDVAEPRNAFAVRLPPAPPPPPKIALPVTPVVKPFMGPLLPPPPPPAPPPPPPPFQVIGTWEDDKGPSVFLSGPRATVQARTGDVLISEYQVVRVNRQEIVLRRLGSHEDIRIAIPVSSSATRP